MQVYVFLISTYLFLLLNSALAQGTDPLLEHFDSNQTNECTLDPSEADLKEAQAKFQKWINSNLPNTKDLTEIAKTIVSKFDTDGDNKISATELESLLKEASIGNWITRTCWANGIIDFIEKESAETDKDQILTPDEIAAGLKKMGISPPPRN